jgi:hypothetical protein
MHPSTYAVFQLAWKPSERINRVSRGLAVFTTKHSFTLFIGFRFHRTIAQKHPLFKSVVHSLYLVLL